VYLSKSIAVGIASEQSLLDEFWRKAAK
jgi:hypothetical protein